MSQGQAQPNPYQGQAGAPAEDPAKTLSIVGLVLAIVAPLIGLIISIVARKQSRAAGYDNGMAKAGVIIGAILTVLGVIGTIIYVIFIASLMNSGQLPR